MATVRAASNFHSSNRNLDLLRNAVRVAAASGTGADKDANIAARGTVGTSGGEMNAQNELVAPTSERMDDYELQWLLIDNFGEPGRRLRPCFYSDIIQFITKKVHSKDKLRAVQKSHELFRSMHDLNRIRGQIWFTFEDATSSWLARIISTTVMLLIATSVTCFCLETVPELRSEEAKSIFHIIEICVVVCFTIEYLMRFMAAPNVWNFVRTPLNIVDFLAIAPFYFSAIFQVGHSGTVGDATSLPFLRLLRFARVLRVLKLTRHSRGLMVLAKAMYISISPMFLLLFFMTLAVVIFSSLIYYVERGDYDTELDYFIRPGTNKAESKFQSIPHSFWWTVVTMTTVGYGDVVPVTWAGKFVASAAMICGLLAIALPVSIIGTNFQNVYDEVLYLEELKRVQEMHKEAVRKRKENGEPPAEVEAPNSSQQQIKMKQQEMEELLETAMELVEKAKGLNQSIKIQLQNDETKRVRATRLQEETST